MNVIAFALTILFFVSASSGVAFATPENEDGKAYERYNHNYGAVQWALPTLSGADTIGTGGSVLVSRANGIWATAYHVLPEEYPALKEDAGYLTVAGHPAKLVCASQVSDIAILQTKTVPEKSVEAIFAPPIAGMEVFALMEGGLMSFTTLQHSNEGLNALVTTATQHFKARIDTVFEAHLHNGTLNPKPTGEWFFSLDKSLRSGFSGGGIMNAQGETLGLAVSITGGVSYVTSSKNINKLLASDDCKKAAIVPKP